MLKSGAPLILEHFFKRRPADSGAEAEAADSQASVEAGAGPVQLDRAEMDAFFKAFLQSDASRNPVLSGYFAAIVGSLLAKKHSEMLAYFFADPELAELFLARLEVPSLLDLLRGFLSLDTDDHFEIFEADLDTPRPNASQPFLSERCSLFAKLRQAYRSTRDADVKLNIKQLIGALTKDVTPFAGAETQLHAMLYDDADFFAHLFADMVDLSPGADRLGAKASAGLVIELLSALNPGRKVGDSLAQQMNSYVVKKKLAEQVSARLRTAAFATHSGGAGLEQVVCSGLQQVASFLARARLPQAVNAAGAESCVLDSHQLALFEVVLATVQLDSDVVDRALLELQLLPLMTVASA